MNASPPNQHVKTYPRDRGDFLYNRAGPWPQPAPDHPMAMAAEVLHPAKADKLDWKRTAGRTYFKTMLTSIPRAAYNAYTRGRVEDISDEVFAELLTTTIYSKYLRGTELVPLPPDLRAAVDPLDDRLRHYTMDFTPMQDIAPYDGIWVSPTVTLFSVDPAGGRYRALAIRIGHLDAGTRKWSSIVVTPEDAEAWTLSKYFVLQGAGHVTTLAGHPATHFPFDTVNAITASAVPMDHTLFKLLLPHMRLALAVNHAVLEGGNSVVSETHGEIYAPYSAPGARVRVLVAAGYIGYPHALSSYANSSTPTPAYPKWEYPLVPRALDIPSDFGRVLKAYHETITEFVRKVVAYVLTQPDQRKRDEEIYYIQCWAHYIAHWMPGFPDADRILELDEKGDPYLVSAVTAYIWDVSVAHSLDHRSFYRLHPNRTPFRIRVPPPTSNRIDAVSPRRILHGWDLFKATLAFDMFFQPHNVELLQDVQYGFGNAVLDGAVEDFRRALVETEARLAASGVVVENYIPLGEIATSIQY